MGLEGLGSSRGQRRGVNLSLRHCGNMHITQATEYDKELRNCIVNHVYQCVRVCVCPYFTADVESEMEVTVVEHSHRGKNSLLICH